MGRNKTERWKSRLIKQVQLYSTLINQKLVWHSLKERINLFIDYIVWLYDRNRVLGHKLHSFPLIKIISSVDFALEQLSLSKYILN